MLAAVTGKAPFDLVLLDLNLPGATGLSCLHALRQIVPTTPIVVISAVGDPKVMQDAIMGGASAFIPKSAPSQVLINALKVILAGGTYMPTGVVAALRNADNAAASSELTLRQRRVLELLSTGLSNKGIARELRDQRDHGQSPCLGDFSQAWGHQPHAGGSGSPPPARLRLLSRDALQERAQFGEMDRLRQ